MRCFTKISPGQVGRSFKNSKGIQTEIFLINFVTTPRYHDEEKETPRLFGRSAHLNHQEKLGKEEQNNVLIY